MINYYKAKRYAKKCGFKTDLVHDAYIRWFNKTGNNLFYEPEHRVMAVMRFTVLAHREKNSRIYFGKKLDKLQYNEYPVLEEGVNNEYLAKTEPNHYDYCTYNEVTARLAAVEGFSRKVYDYLKNGYNSTEIAESEKVSIQKVFHHIKKIRYIAGSNHYYKHQGAYYERNNIANCSINTRTLGTV